MAKDKATTRTKAKSRIRQKNARVKKTGAVQTDIEKHLFMLAESPVYLHSTDRTHKVAMKVADNKIQEYLNTFSAQAKEQIGKLLIPIDARWTAIYKECFNDEKVPHAKFQEWWKKNVETQSNMTEDKFELLTLLERYKALNVYEKLYEEAKKRAKGKGGNEGVQLLIEEGFVADKDGVKITETGVYLSSQNNNVTKARQEKKDLRWLIIDKIQKVFSKENNNKLNLEENKTLQNAFHSLLKEICSDSDLPLLDIFAKAPQKLKDYLQHKKEIKQKGETDLVKEINDAVAEALSSKDGQNIIKTYSAEFGRGVIAEATAQFSTKGLNQPDGDKELCIVVANASELTSDIDNTAIKTDTKAQINNIVLTISDKTSLIPLFGVKPASGQNVLNNLRELYAKGYTAKFNPTENTLKEVISEEDVTNLILLQNYVVANSSFWNRTAEDIKKKIMATYAWLLIVRSIVGSATTADTLPIAIRVFGDLYRTDTVLKEIQSQNGDGILKYVKGRGNFYKANTSSTDKERAELKKLKNDAIYDFTHDGKKRLNLLRQEVSYSNLKQAKPLKEKFEQLTAAIVDEKTKKIRGLPSGMYFQIKLENVQWVIGEE